MGSGVCISASVSLSCLAVTHQPFSIVSASASVLVAVMLWGSVLSCTQASSVQGLGFPQHPAQQALPTAQRQQPTPTGTVSCKAAALTLTLTLISHGSYLLGTQGLLLAWTWHITGRLGDGTKKWDRGSDTFWCLIAPQANPNVEKEAGWAELKVERGAEVKGCWRGSTGVMHLWAALCP